MRTDCTEEQLVFQGVGGRRVVARFDGGRITSDAGMLLLREVPTATSDRTEWDPICLTHDLSKLFRRPTGLAGARP